MIIITKRYGKFLIAIAILILALSFSGICEAAQSQQNFSQKDFYRSLSKRLSKNRADYKNLSDAEFANFREVTTTGIGKGKLFRSSSPVKAWGNREQIADELAKNAQIKTFINTADSDAKILSLENFSGTYYSTQNFIGLDTGLKFQSRKFRQAIARGISFMAANDPPYLIHCDLGKDRAGIFCAIVECLCGASELEIEADYMISFKNYFGIMPETGEYELVVNSEIRRFLPLVLADKNTNSQTTKKFLLRIGVSEQEIATLIQKLQ